MIKKTFLKNITNFQQATLFCFSERIGSIKFIGRRNKPFYSNSEASTNKDNLAQIEVKKVEAKSGLTNTPSSTKSKEAELRLKVNNKLFKDFINDFQNLKADKDLHNIKFTEVDNEQVNMGANLDLPDWNSIKLKQSI